MESGPPPPDRPGDGEESETSPEGPQAPAGPQAPQPGAPQPGGPQAPAPGPQAPQFPPPPAVGPSTAPTPSPPAPEQFPPPAGPPGQASAPGYGGPVPPGGWQAPLSHPQSAWAGRPLASWWSRVAAALLDGLIITIPVLVLVGIVIAIVAAGSNVGGALIAIVSFVAYFVAVLFYAPVLMARGGPNNGQTWGKQIVGITVIRDSGAQVDMGFAFLREVVVKNLLFGWIGSFFAGIPTLLNYLWPLWDDQNRCLHDMIVSTHVVRVSD